jgi:hypothetical protein
MNIQGYIGLLPRFINMTAEIDRSRPSLVYNLFDRGLIAEPIAAINLNNSTLTLGAFDTSNDTIDNITLFNRHITYIQLDQEQQVYFRSARVKEYRWSAILITPDEELLSNTWAKFEIDLPYISVPEKVFKNISSYFNLNFKGNYT